MLQNFRISSRLLVLTVVQFVLLGLIAAIGFLNLNATSNSMATLGKGVEDGVHIGRLAEQVRGELSGTVNALNLGGLSWEQGLAQLKSARVNFRNHWEEYFASLDSEPALLARDLHGFTLENVNEAFDNLIALAERRDRKQFTLYVANDYQELIPPYFDMLQARASFQQFESDENLATAKQTGQQFLLGSLGMTLLGMLISAFFGYAVYRSISRPIDRIASVVQQVGAGEYAARTELQGSDELGELGRAFDQVLNDRVTDLAAAQTENERLNDSIIGVLQAVFQLSQRDLTVRVPVTEDVTGPVADALNLLTDETARVLGDVTRISGDVANASGLVKSQSDKVLTMAEVERQEVDQTASELADAANAMNHIAELAQACNAAADNAINNTETALETVTSTVEGINSTRDTIRETEKRIKRLGERSQEINSVVNIINTIAERTHILALNASMHAASAGEAGRGFAVVANEVQRLAENAREATSQIGTLVSNIQSETVETVSTMNDAISQVVEGSRLAERAGVQMMDTKSTTAELVAAVQQIADNSQQQAQSSNELLKRAAQIRESTQLTSAELEQQAVQTDNLVSYARGLVESVGVFKLPVAAKPEPVGDVAAAGESRSVA